MAEQKVSHKQLHVPALEEVAKVFQAALEANFEFVQVSIAECPDLTEKPFHLAAPGICGSPRLIDVGGVPYLFPLPQKDKIYKLKTVAGQADLPDAFLIGAGAGPHNTVGVNCELMPNVFFKDGADNTHVALLNKNGKPELRQWPKSDVAMLGNLFASEGQPGNVIKVIARKRTGSDNFVSTLRKALKERYEDKPVGVGGVFLIRTGSAKLHIMPDFSTVELKNDFDVGKWLNYFNFSAPLTCLSTFISHDPDLDLRVEHTHCIGLEHGQGGHYHNDTSPESVQYEAYFNLAQFIYRIDPPAETHQFGRD